MIIGVFLYAAFPVFLYQTVFAFIPYQRRRNEVLGMLASLLNVAYMSSFTVIQFGWLYYYSLILGTPAILFSLARLVPPGASGSSALGAATTAKP